MSAAVRRRALARTRALFAHDRALGTARVAGADEAGRGSLAGPLVAAAVRFDYSRMTLAERRELSGLDDSKRITPEERSRLYGAILLTADRVSIVVRGAPGIDRRGLHVTNLGALGEVLEAVAGDDTTCMVDGFAVPDCQVDHLPVVKGDATSAAIAAASVIAKVTRDRHMERAGERFPGWGFEEHVGYGTEGHREAIVRLGTTPLHRLSFNSAAYGFGTEPAPTGG